MSEADDEKDAHESAPTDAPVRVIPAEELFAGRREVWIEHDGVRYKLLITGRRKLLLLK